MDIKGLAQQRAAHHRTLDVPARTPLSPGGIPGGFPRFGRFPQCEVETGALPIGGSASLAEHLIECSIAEFAVPLELLDLEIDIAVRLVGVPLLDQILRETNDVIYVLGRLRELVNRVDSHRGEVRPVVFGHLTGDFGHREAAPIRFLDQLVIDVGNVDDKRDVVPRIDEVLLNRVEDHRPDHMADVARFIDGRPAKIHTDLVFPHRNEIFLGSA